MNFPLERPGLNEDDMTRVYRYAPQKTTICRFLEGDATPALWFLESSRDVEEWLQKNKPSPDTDSGIVLILAPRAGENAGLLEQFAAGKATFGRTEIDNVFKGSFNEKDRSYSWPKGEFISSPRGRPRPKRTTKTIRGGGREVRQVPFEKDSFREICNAFFVHSSISRAISRADVPLFSRIDIKVSTRDDSGTTQPAIAYNCRSANTWRNDLALTVTYLPQRNLTFAILFGCTAAVEQDVLNRLASAQELGFHPLLLPGIFVELERGRMAEVVESTIDRIEETIYELDTGESTYEAADGDHPAGPRHVRRTVWLNVTFLRNRLRILRTQYLKMIEHVEDLLTMDLAKTPESNELLRKTGRLTRDRLKMVIEELEEMIDDCSMRVDGMTIATQWSQGDTTVEIASAAGRDSSQMRSISLVTMIFLPGTFLATVFSMTFFRWDPEDGNVVSSYIWIYVVIAAAFTAVTLVLWWYFLVYRASKSPGTSTNPFKGLGGRIMVLGRILCGRPRSKESELEEA
ncbi:hypothetical protein B0T24DRAFT_626774 [Lasiosphaeria ovina]|uniref:Uncharacterized protein n=1 Tax=Lasiosphaeria ovina TaxID=92902 RepID=A0AAE0KDB5_9PEZI|nr:hypothetical protein B0T24DRAFT_626774 [Lasiosphaeria ovina]